MQNYKVIGPHDIDGIATGGTVELSDEDGARLTASGHVEPIAARTTKPSTTPTESSEEK